MWTVILSEPLLLTGVAALASATLGWFGFWRSLRGDRIAKQSGAATFQLGAVDQIIKGLNDLVDQLQEDNKSLREGFKDLTERVKELITERNTLALELAALKGSLKGE